MATREKDRDPEPIDQEESKAKGGKAGKDRPDRERAERDDRDDRDERDDEEKSEKSRRGKRKSDADEDDRDERGKKDKKDKKDRKRDDMDDEDEDPPRDPRALKVGDRKVPYPLPPEDVPEGLTDYPESFVRQQNILLAGLFIFLTFYVGAILFTILIGVWCIWSFSHLTILKLPLLIASGVCFVFLLKGMFKRQAVDRESLVELTEEEHPLLFEFIYALCEEVDAPEPNKVYVVPDVNAACIAHISLFSLFSEPKKDLLIGLGLVNAVNLSEFKAIFAHELGHFSNVGNVSNYTRITQRVILNLIVGEDWLDRFVIWCKRNESLKALGYVIGGPLWLWRVTLFWGYKAIAMQSMVVSREQEFHADLVAVSAAGSDAATHGLLRARFGMECFIQALRDLHTAMDHKLYTNDLYLHQSRAAAVVRRLKKEPEMGLPPALNSTTHGKSVRVFDAEQDEIEDEDDTPPMWRSHPSDADREDNAKEQFVAAPQDHRSPWILFDDVAELKERMTYKFFRSHPAFRIPKNAELTDAVKVQKFIDNEHADTTYDPKYKGAYDERILEPGDLSELNGIIRESPWTDERMEKVLDKLYDDCEEHAEAHSELYKEMEALQSGIVGRPSPKMKRKIEEVEKKQEENRDWFKSFDRRVYLLHMQMAAQVDKELRSELLERYRFQLEVQRLFQESRSAFNKADAYLEVHNRWQKGEIQLPPDFTGEVIQVLRESWKALKNIIKDAREINLPAMKNFEEGENLAEFILEGKMVPEPPLSYVKGAWINKLMTQLQGVRQKCFRLHFKSVGGILRMHEDIATKWRALREPVAAEVVDAVEAEPIAAEVVPADVVAAEVIPAEVLPAAPLPAVPQPQQTGVPPLPEPPKSVAAFVAPAPPPPAPDLRPPAPPVAAVTPPAPVAPAAPPPVPPVPASVPVPEPEPIAAQVIEPQPVAPVPVAPAPPAELKSLDLSAPEPAPAPAPAPAGAAVFAFDEQPPAPSPAKPSAPAETVSLDADDHAVVQPQAIQPAEAPPAPPPPVERAPEPEPQPQVQAAPPDGADAFEPAEVEVVEAPQPVFSLDADDHKPPPKSGVVPAAAPRAPEPSTPALSGVAPSPAPRTPPGSGVTRAPSTRPANGKRPPIKITMVRPGEPSPLAR